MSDTVTNKRTPSFLPRMCWFNSTGLWPDWESGMLYAWGMAHVVSERGPGMYPIGIIEDMSGQIHSIHITRISLTRDRPGNPGDETTATKEEPSE